MAVVNLTADGGLTKEILREGDGDMPSPGSNVKAHYTGTLLDGTVFDSSVKRGRPFTFTIGIGQVVRPLAATFRNSGLVPRVSCAALDSPPCLRTAAFRTARWRYAACRVSCSSHVHLPARLFFSPCRSRAGILASPRCARAKNVSSLASLSMRTVATVRRRCSSSTWRTATCIQARLRWTSTDAARMRVPATAASQSLNHAPASTNSAAGAGGVIPGGATLKFEVELLDFI